MDKKPSGEIIKVHPKLIVLFIVLVISLFGLFIYLSNKQAGKYKSADFNTEIKPTEVNRKEVFGSLRGALFYKKNWFIDKGALLVGNNPVDKKLWDSYGPAIDLNSEPHHYTLGDLKLPFIVSKQANSDIILVKKDSLTFKFKLEAK